MSLSDLRADSTDLLTALPALAELPDAVRDLVVASFVPEQYAFGEVLVRQGDEATAVYVIASGRVRVVREHLGTDVALGVLTAGDTFGETAVLTGGQRNATVRASTDVEVLRLDGAVFAALARSHPGIRRAFEVQARLHEIERFLRVDSMFAELPTSALPTIARQLEERTYDAGELAVVEGADADALLLIQDGRLVVFTADGDVRKNLRYLRTGDFFGEAGIVRGVPRAASVEAVTSATVLALPADAFLALLAEHPALAARVNERIERYGRDESAAVPLDFADYVAPEADRSEWHAGAAAPAPVEVADDETPAEPQTWAHRRRWPRQRYPTLRQIDEMDCGAASLGIVCRAFGRPVSLSRIRDACGTSIDGTSLRGLKRGGEQIGLRVRTVKASVDRRQPIPLPAIIHWENYHWLVLFEVDEKHAWISDPARGLRRIDRAELDEKWNGYAALCEPTPQLADAPVSTVGARWLWQFARPQRRVLALAVALAMGSAAVEMLLPVLSQQVVDRVLPHHDRALLNLLGLGMLGLLLAGVGAALLQSRLLSRVAFAIDTASFEHISERMLRLPAAYFASRRTGDIERRLDGLRQIRQLFARQGVQAMIAATQFLVAIAVMFGYSWRLGLVFLATLPVYAVLMTWSTRRLRPALDDLEEGYGKYRSRQLDAIKGIETVKALGAEDGLRATILREFSDLGERIVRADRTVMGYQAVAWTATLLLVLLFLWLGAVEVLGHHLSLGALVSFNALVLLATAPLQVLLALWDQTQLSAVLLGRLRDIVEQEPEQDGGKQTLRPVPTLAGQLSLEDVWFAFPNSPDTPILRGITLDIEPGTKVALVGRSGSGKSTLIRCLAGLAEPTRGSIKYDGIALDEVDHRELRRRIGVVLQQPHIFSDTIEANIAVGELTPDADQVQWAAEVADAHGFVTGFPLGYRTRIGETGVALSGGQQQRIAIARAIYHRPPVILLDEATSALDTESERAVKQQMDTLLVGRTAVIVAHRLSTIRDADLIVVLDRGRIVETGSHEDLMRRAGLYAHLQAMQLPG